MLYNGCSKCKYGLRKTIPDSDNVICSLNNTELTPDNICEWYVHWQDKCINCEYVRITSLDLLIENNTATCRLQDSEISTDDLCYSYLKRSRNLEKYIKK